MKIEIQSNADETRTRIVTEQVWQNMRDRGHASAWKKIREIPDQPVDVAAAMDKAAEKKAAKETKPASTSDETQS